jgi:DNA processing protein
VSAVIEDERAYWVMLSMATGIGPVRFQRLLEICGGARGAWEASDLELAAAGLERRTADSLRRLRQRTSPDAVGRRLAQLGIRALTLLDDDYPSNLRQVADAPPVLFVRGRLLADDGLAVALVGTRRATPYGRAVAERLARDLVTAGVTIVSGLAKGVDTAAHQAALDAGGRTLAVLGNGLDQVYPPENGALARRIAEAGRGALVSEFAPGGRTVAVLGNGLDQVYPPENGALARRIAEAGRGALVSEFAPGVPPDAVNFPRRNRIISGLSRATLIVEAGERSGALITADFALEQGREVVAVPGSIFNAMSVGTNQLLRQGATPVTSAQEVLDIIGASAQAATTMAHDLPEGSPAEAMVWRALTGEPRHGDELARTLGLSSGEVAAALAMLELKGLARQVGSMLYTRV